MDIGDFCLCLWGGFLVVFWEKSMDILCFKFGAELVQVLVCLHVIVTINDPLSYLFDRTS